MTQSTSLATASYKTARRIIIGIMGTTVCLIGVVMLVTPGPAFVVIPAGLAILGVEFAFARRWLGSLRRHISKTMQKKRLQNAQN